MSKVSILSCLIFFSGYIYASAPSKLSLTCTSTLEVEFESNAYHTQQDSFNIAATNPMGIIIDDPHTSFDEDFQINFTYNLPPMDLPSQKTALTVSLFKKDQYTSQGLGLIKLPFDAKEFSMTGFTKIENEYKCVTVKCIIHPM